jgi:peptidoglycan glycosyltransferase
MDKPIRRLFFLFALLFVALLVGLTYVQVWAAPKLKTNPSNTRAIEQEMKIDRGNIYSADGVELAVNDKDGQYYVRRYPQGSLTSPWLGYNSQRYGRAGVERIYNEALSGQSGLLGITSYWDQLMGKTHAGADLKLTINMTVQRAAAEALGDRKGAVVALDPRTGAVLAMVSYPGYDPNELESQWQDINSNNDRPLVNRVTSGLYPPGSAFKIIVAAAGLETGIVTPETRFTDTGSVTAGGFVVHNYGDNTYGDHDFTKAFASSINTTFAKLGIQMGAETMANYAAAFGFGKQPPWVLGGSASVFPAPTGMDKAHLAQVSYGQGEVLATPLQIALAASAVANGGEIMKPYLVAQILSRGGDVLSATKPEGWLAAISSDTAAIVRDLMIEVVNNGTGTRAGLTSVQVAGKTGTADVAGAASHAWFAGFAPAEAPRVVVAVLVENGGTGGSVAAPIARAVIAAALEAAGK